MIRLSVLVFGMVMVTFSRAHLTEHQKLPETGLTSDKVVKELHTKNENCKKSGNPFFTQSSLPFQAPQFNCIEESDYQPAIHEGIKQYLKEVENIATNQQEATFENTFIALEKSGVLLERVMQVFGAMTSANSSDTLQQVDEEISPKLAAMDDAIKLNTALFERIRHIYQQIGTLDLDPESLRLVEVTYHNFVLAGANLSGADKNKLKALNQEAATLSTQFTNKLLAANKSGSLVITDQNHLHGLSEEEVAAAAQAASERKLGKQWLLVLQNTTQQPDLKTLSDRETRKALFKASWGRAEKNDVNDTREIISRLAQIRANQAKLLGFENYASWKLQNQMAKTPKEVLDFITRIVPAAIARAERESNPIQALIDKQHGGFKLAPWDWQFYVEQVRKAQYNLDEAQIKPYFELNNVLQNGIFYAAERLYGISFKERKDLPVYQEDVRVFEVFDTDKKPLALFYTDYFKRDNKRGGAWMSNFVDQSKLQGTKPVIYTVANIRKPLDGQPALLSYDEVITLFHEFGHALHGMFADQQYRSLSGTATARDFVEFPSQFNEHWASDPQVFAHYAKHYQTGEAMPTVLVEKINQASKFNKGYGMTELLSAALLDIGWHMLGAEQPLQNVNEFETTVLKTYKVDLNYVPPRYRSSYFQHIWDNGYSAGYYAYLWTEMLADDAFDWFKQHGGLMEENGKRFRNLVLSRGNSQDLKKLYINWRGKEPSIEPMLINRGLKEDN